MNYKVRSETELKELLKTISIDDIVSMSVMTCEGSSLEGISWEYLQYIYDAEGVEESVSYQETDWTEKVIHHKVKPTNESILKDFQELQDKGCRFRWDVWIETV